MAKVLGDSARTRFGAVYVLQAQPGQWELQEHRAGLAGEDGTVRNIELPISGDLGARYEPVIPLRHLDRMLTEVENDYPVGALTAALAQALGNVVHLWIQARSTGYSLDLRSLDEAIGLPLREHAIAWNAVTAITNGS